MNPSEEPFLDKLPRRHPYKVPERYFDDLPRRVQMRIQKPVQQYWLTYVLERFRWQMSLATALLLVASWFMLYQPAHFQEQSTTALQQLSDDEVIEYLAVNQQELELDDMPISLVSEDDLLPAIPDRETEEIEKEIDPSTLEEYTQL